MKLPHLYKQKWNCNLPSTKNETATPLQTKIKLQLLYQRKWNCNTPANKNKIVTSLPAKMKLQHPCKQKELTISLQWKMELQLSYNQK